MNILKFFITIFVIFSLNHALAKSNIVFIDIDYLIQNSNIGKLTLEKIEKNNLSNTNILKNKETSLRNKENEIKKKKNIITKEQFEVEVNNLKKDIDTFNKEKKKIISDFNKFKIDELNILLDKFNKIINEYVTQNSIELVLNKKNLYMGKVSSDITKDILTKINEK
tara:strand:+ start:892 stop:1392 length:501 start_codon:yes stop_codon:yes gene_type:complete